MRYVKARGYPVPRVVSVTDNDLILDKVEGPTMQEALMQDLGRIDEQAAALAHLHDLLHRIEAPAWLPQRVPGERVLHLDLHPANVILSAQGPVVIDWANAATGPAALDPALAIAIFVAARASAPIDVSGIDAFIRSFAQHFDTEELRAALPQAIEMRSADPNVTDDERRELLSLDWPLG